MKDGLAWIYVFSLEAGMPFFGDVLQRSSLRPEGSVTAHRSAHNTAHTCE